MKSYFARTAVALTAVALLGGVGLTAASASTHPSAKPNNTGSCGHNCIEPFFLASGHQWVLVDHNGLTTANTAINLQFKTVTNSREDWLPLGAGPVVKNYCPNQTPIAVDPVLSANNCAYLVNNSEATETAEELEFTPLGVQTGMCVGLWNNQTATAGLRTRLEPCGDSPDTVWIEDAAHTRVGFVPFINGGSNNFEFPLVATEQSGAPAYQAIRLQQVNEDTHGIVEDQQLVNFEPGL